MLGNDRMIGERKEGIMAEKSADAAARPCNHPAGSIFQGEAGEDTFFRDKPAYVPCERCKEKISTDYLQDHPEEQERFLFDDASAA